MNTTDDIHWKDVPCSPADLKFSKPYPIKKITSSLENIKVPDDWKKHVDIRLVKPEHKKLSCFMHTGQSNEWSTLRQMTPSRSNVSNSISNRKCTCKQLYPLNSSRMTA